MASTRLLGDADSGQDVCTGLAPSRMDLIDEWSAPHNDVIELYIDIRAGDGWLILVPHHQPEEHIATVFHAGGVTRATVWHGTGAEQTELWRDTQRCKAIAAIATRNADASATDRTEPDEAAA